MRTAGQGFAGFEKRDGFMKPGQELVMAGYAGFVGTCRIGEYKREELLERFPSSFLETLDHEETYSVRGWMEGERSQQDGSVTAYEYAEEGGVLAALWNLSGIYNAGITVNLRAIPILQITVEICELYELNPYRLLCGNCVLMSTDRGGRLAGCLKDGGIPAAVIGRADEGIARQIIQEEGAAGYLERPKPDELFKLLPGSRVRTI